MAAAPGRLIPSASTRQPIVLAVPIKEQEPHVGQEKSSTVLNSSREILSVLYIPRASETEVESDPRPPNGIPLSIGPPFTKMAGILSLAAAINIPGIILSQDPNNTIPSRGFPSAMISIESNMISLEGTT